MKNGSLMKLILINDAKMVSVMEIIRREPLACFAGSYFGRQQALGLGRLASTAGPAKRRPGRGWGTQSAGPVGDE